jgi:hypothetical protein
MTHAPFFSAEPRKQIPFRQPQHMVSEGLEIIADEIIRSFGARTSDSAALR